MSARGGTPQQADDLSVRDREPIYISGSVQPQGVLLVADRATLTIRQVSQSAGEQLAVEASALLGTSLPAFLGEPAASALQRLLDRGIDTRPRHLAAAPIGPDGEVCEGMVHCHQGKLIVELERRGGDPGLSAVEAYAALGDMMRLIEGAPSLSEFCRLAAEQVRAFTGFDRVMICRFLEDASGVVVAESKRDDLESYKGLRYPASVIPQQDRELYTQSWLRLIPDVDAPPSPILSIAAPSSPDEVPLDLSYAVNLRVSPVHLEHMRNMGVRASMSISLLRGGNLWGLIACHHMTPRHVPKDARMACELLAHTLSLQVSAKEDAADHAYATALEAHRARIVSALAEEDSYPRGLLRPSLELLGWIRCGGVALVTRGWVSLLGRTPSEPEVQRLVDWLSGEVGDEVFATDHLAAAYTKAPIDVPLDAPIEPEVASGLLALRLGSSKREYLLWFRPELLQGARRASDPHKADEETEGTRRLSPRKSFAAWQETVRGRSAPWMPCEIEGARSLRRSLMDLILRKADKRAALNVEFERRNIELDAFAYIDSHDLKEPLRGIQNYSRFLLEDYAELIDESGRAKVQTMVRLSQKLESLLDSILYYSRVGRAELTLEEVDLQKVLDRALEVLAPRVAESRAEVRVPRRLTKAKADRERVGEIFVNLIANALKFNDKPNRWVEVGFEEARSGPDGTTEPAVFYVRDNGIGIPAKHHDTVFRIFKRLHGREAYGGGVGAGLSVVKKIVERHGGTIWLDSRQGAGTTFYFTLG